MSDDVVEASEVNEEYCSRVVEVELRNEIVILFLNAFGVAYTAYIVVNPPIKDSYGGEMVLWYSAHLLPESSESTLE